MDVEDWDDVQAHNLAVNGKAWHMLKLAEECAELSGAILKYYTKGESDVEILKEIADVEIAILNVRLFYKKHESIIDLCTESKKKRIAQKTEELLRDRRSMGAEMKDRMG